MGITIFIFKAMFKENKAFNVSHINVRYLKSTRRPIFIITDIISHFLPFSPWLCERSIINARK